ncbi:hypothetical protein [Paludisphaera mucosa]|uniref:Uncharacterized protein n=1 Tax=Paludisphaera mucosa TaxID=3030827 RepID=A0ABT6FJR2_9BACT|nr:hypothetical protein [Paludisphaera mucosa]MDG3007787.1 hypothetical protein [Paludisphaera mucosa]
MDGHKRAIFGWTLPAGVWIAAQLAAPGSCPGQDATAPVRPSASSIPAPARPKRVDADVQRSHFHEGQASPQQAPPVPSKSYAPPASPPSPPATQTPSYAPPYPGYPPQYPGYAPPQYAPQYMMVPMMAPPAAGPPAGNFFLPGGPPAGPGYAPPAPGYPMMPMAPAAPAYGMMPMMAPAAPALAGAVAGSSVSVPTSSSTTSVEIRGPGMLSAALARVGERMVQMGRTRVRTVHETVLQTPAAAPVGGTATIATSGLVPVPPPAPPQAPPENAPPESPVPSPQGSHSHEKSHRWFGHD